MAVPEQTPYSEHTGNGVTKSFALGFICESKDHLIVLVDEIEPPIATWSLSAGNVVFTTAPISGSKITIQRNTPFSRSVDYQSYNNSFRPQSVNGDFDRLWLKLQELGVADWLMKLYVDRLHQQQEDKIDNLKIYVDDKDDELRAYLMEEIRKQGVALDQLDEYYNYLMQRLAQIAIDKGWDASFVVDGNKNQHEINSNTAYYYINVAAMVADEDLEDGDIVGTRCYRNIFDDGGATYLISSTATSYSIPLANGLHAVFRDTFDIRKFGIVNNATLDQTADLARMVAYADTRIYEIDFHNFDIMTPKIWTKVLTRGVLANTTTPININPSDVMGLPFKKVHKLKNLKIYNDKTTRLNTSHCQIVFAPDENPAMASWFILENVTFDPWVDNYQPITENYLGNYDGLRCGFFCYPSVAGLVAPNFMTNINFHFKDIHFASPAYSYNMTTACILCNTIIVENVSGKHLGLGLNWFAKNLFVKNFRSVYDSSKHEAGRSIVTNTMQFEPEVAGWGPITIDNIYVDGLEGNFICHKVSSSSGVDTFKRVYLNDTKGNVGIYAADTSKYIVEDYQSYNHTGTYGNSATIGTFLADNFTHRVLTNSPLVPLHYGSYEKFIIRNSDFRERVLTANAINTYTCQYLEISNTWGTNAFPLLRNDVKIPTIVMSDLKYIGTSNIQIIRGSWDSLTIDGITADVSETAYANSIFYNGSTPAKLNLLNAVIDRPAPAADFFILAGTAGLLTANIVGSVSRTPLKTNNVTLKETACIPKRTYSKTFDWPSLAAGQAQSTTISVPGAVVGDDVGCSFSQPLLGTRLWAEVTAAGVVTVYQQNPTAAAVDVTSGTLAVWLR